MAAFLDLCRFVASAGGTADWTYVSTVSPYISPTDAGAVNGRVYKVRAESADLTQWEVSEGAYSSAGTGSFARTTVLYNSSGTGTLQSGAGTKINFSAAPQVWVVASKRDLLAIEEANGFTKTQKAQGRANISVSAFSAHKNGTDQTGINSATYTKVTFGNELFDPDGCFDTTNSRWTPTAGKVVMSSQIWVTGTFPAGNSTVIAVYKNGTVFRGGFTYPSVANASVAFVTIVDDANGADYYEMFVAQTTSSGTVTVKGDATWTYFTGSVI